jgi:hypothetical protein
VTGIINLRFVAGSGIASGLIELDAGTSMPFAPSHVECVSPDGKWYIGQRHDGGMQPRAPGYDVATTRHEKFVALQCEPEQQASFYEYINGKIGQPYDWRSILDFVDPALNLHAFNHLICSAIVTAGLRAAPHPYFRWPLTKPFHRISPDMLLLLLSSHQEISHEASP